jgi:hypothetical protein
MLIAYSKYGILGTVEKWVADLREQDGELGFRRMANV